MPNYNLNTYKDEWHFGGTHTHALTTILVPLIHCRKQRLRVSIPVHTSTIVMDPYRSCKPQLHRFRNLSDCIVKTQLLPHIRKVWELFHITSMVGPYAYVCLKLPAMEIAPVHCIQTTSSMPDISPPERMVAHGFYIPRAAEGWASCVSQPGRCQ